MKDTVRIEVSKVLVNGAIQESVAIYLNNALKGVFDVSPGDPVLALGLIVAGFERVDISGAGMGSKSLTREELLERHRHVGVSVTAPLTGKRGTVALKKFQPKCFDDWRFDVFINGAGAWQWPLAQDSLETLAAVLSCAACDTEILRHEGITEYAVPLAA